MVNPPSQVAYHYRDALRLLFVLQAGSEEEVGTAGFGRVFRGEKRLLGLDFLIRYPDYLADALLDLYDQSKDRSLLSRVEEIFLAQEPDVRLIKMVRWRHGAFENHATALSILSSRGLIRTRKKVMPNKRSQYEFPVADSVAQFLSNTVKEHPELGWYQERVALAMKVASGLSGSAIKGMQYEHPEYANASYGSIIPSIQGRVKKRLDELQGARK